MKFFRTQQLGFTLIEMIVSLAVFSIVITISVGALLVLISTNQQLQNEQSVMTNLSFALDSMAREIRTGTHYFCVARPNYTSGSGNAVFDNGDSQELLGQGTNDCPTGSASGMNLLGISFKEGGESITAGNGERILYFYDKTGGPNSGKIMRRVGDQDAQSIVSSGIYITAAEFYVTGSKPLNAVGVNEDQSMITIFIEAKDKNDVTAKPYRIQTTITQRTLDI